MKSLLVDAMRQANKGDNGAALSDSGSFDTTSDQFTETANDAVVETPQPPADDLQLMDPDAIGSDATGIETLAADEPPVPVLPPEPDIAKSGSRSELSAKMAAFNVAVPGVSKAPRLSRFSPAICLALSFAAALGWSGWEYWQAQVAGSALGTPGTPGASQHSAAQESDGGSRVERFPFIAATESAAGTEADE